MNWRLPPRSIASWLVATSVLAGGVLVAQTSQPGQRPTRPTRDTSAAAAGTGKIRGHVFASADGRPLRKAQVRLLSPELRESRVVVTDDGGGYELSELPAGRYTLTAAKGSFVALSYGQIRPFEPGKPIQLADGESLDKIDFKLPKGSIITGRVLDEVGEPVADVQVVAMRYMFQMGQRKLTPIGRTSLTNDVGEFRLFGLPPGDYYVSATVRGIALSGDTPAPDQIGYAPTYYPGTAAVHEAQRIAVGLGQVAAEINVPLVQARTARISGLAIDSSGRPMGGAYVTVVNRNGTVVSTGGNQIKPDGSFAVPNLPPGEYVVRASTAGSATLGEGELAVTSVSVDSADLVGIQLRGRRAVAVSGKLVLDAALAKSLAARTLRVNVVPSNAEDVIGLPTASGPVNDDFSFALKSWPGRMVIRLDGAGPAGAILRAVRVGGSDVTDAGVEFRADADVGDVEIELSSRPSEIAGQVSVDGRAANEFTVLAFATDRGRWGWPTRFIGTGRPDQAGAFRLRFLPPGEYYVIALDYIEPGAWNDPEFLDRVRAKATVVTVAEGEHKSVQLAINASS